jgi:hypothetical protein
LLETERVEARAKLRETEKLLSGVLYERGVDDKEHVENNSGVRKIRIERGLVPENLPPAEDVKKVERRLRTEKEKLLKPGQRDYP